MIDEHLSFNNHVKMISDKATKHLCKGKFVHVLRRWKRPVIHQW